MNIVTGDVFSYIDKCNTYVMHCCNNKKTMGAGIAKEVKNRFTDAYIAYLEGSSELGTITVEDNIINAIAQDSYGRGNQRYLSYDALVLCCEEVNKLKPSRVVVPYLFGSNRAGGDWSIVQVILENSLECPVIACKLN